MRDFSWLTILEAAFLRNWEPISRAQVAKYLLLLLLV